MQIGDIVYIMARNYNHAQGIIIDLPEHDPRYSVALEGKAGYHFKEKDMELVQACPENGGTILISTLTHKESCSYCPEEAIEAIAIVDASKQVHYYFICPNHQSVWR